MEKEEDFEQSPQNLNIENNNMVNDQNTNDAPKRHSNISIDLDDFEKEGKTSNEKNTIENPHEEVNPLLSELNRELSQTSKEDESEILDDGLIQVVDHTIPKKEIKEPEVVKPISQKKDQPIETKLEEELKTELKETEKIDTESSDIDNTEKTQEKPLEKVTKPQTPKEKLVKQDVPITEEKVKETTLNKNIKKEVDTPTIKEIKEPEIKQKKETKKQETSKTPLKKPETKISPLAIRTYRDDLAKVVKTDKISLTQAVIAEETARDKSALKKFPSIKKIDKGTKKKIILTLFSLLLISSGIGFVVFVKYLKPTPIIKVGDVELSSFILSDYQREIFLEESNSINLTNQIKSNINNTNLPIGSVLYIYLTQRNEKGEGIVGKNLITTSELLSILRSRASDSFIRFIEPEFMFGYHSSIDVYPFIIMKTRSFDNSFPEMLAWEANMIEDLRPLFFEEDPSIKSSELRTGDFEFKDIVIRNKDTRAVLNSLGEIVFIYSFVDKNTIIITTNKRTFEEVFNRLTISYRER